MITYLFIKFNKSIYHGADNPSRFLEQFLVLPVRVQMGQLAGNLIVLSHPEGVHHRQLSLFVGSIISSVEAVHVATTTASFAATVRIASLHGQQVFESYTGKGKKCKGKVSNKQATNGEAESAVSDRHCRTQRNDTRDEETNGRTSMRQEMAPNEA